MDPPLHPFMDELSVGSSSDESFGHPYTPADVSCYYLDLQQMDVSMDPPLHPFMDELAVSACLKTEVSK
jgi:hypothetical protein